MTLMHYAAEPLVFDRDKTYEQPEPYSYGKPHGFWVSVSGERDWVDWCESEEFGLDSLRFPHHVALRPDANILWINTTSEMMEFHDEFAVETDYERRNNDLYKQRHWPIDWREVSRHYGGLIIAPYQWSQRLDALWYYGWDCASGCIWSTDAIESVTVSVLVGGDPP